MTHICVGKLSIIGSDNGLSLGRHQAIIWTKAGILYTGPLGNFNRNSNIFIEENTFENVVCEMLPISSRPQCVNWYHLPPCACILVGGIYGWSSLIISATDDCRVSLQSYRIEHYHYSREMASVPQGFTGYGAVNVTYCPRISKLVFLFLKKLVLNQC